MNSLGKLTSSSLPSFFTFPPWEHEGWGWVGAWGWGWGGRVRWGGGRVRWGGGRVRWGGGRVRWSWGGSRGVGLHEG